MPSAKHNAAAAAGTASPGTASAAHARANARTAGESTIVPGVDDGDSEGDEPDSTEGEGAARGRAEGDDDSAVRARGGEGGGEGGVALVMGVRPFVDDDEEVRAQSPSAVGLRGEVHRAGLVPVGVVARADATIAGVEEGVARGGGVSLGIVAAGGQERGDADRGRRLGTLDVTRADGLRERAEQVVFATQRRGARTAAAGERLLDRGEERRDARREDHGGRAPRGAPVANVAHGAEKVCRHDDAPRA